MFWLCVFVSGVADEVDFFLWLVDVGVFGELSDVCVVFADRYLW